MRWGIVINLTRCVGCYACVIGCKQENFLPPDIFFNRVLISEDGGHYPVVAKKMYPAQCNHCTDPPCVEVCPTGANIFGTREELLQEAKRRLALKPGQDYTYPLERVGSTYGHVKAAPNYTQHVFGEHEGGGTQVMVIAGMAHTKLGLPELPDRSYASVSETVQHSIYGGMLAPAGVLAGLLYFARRNTSGNHQDDNEGGES